MDVKLGKILTLLLGLSVFAAGCSSGSASSGNGEGVNSSGELTVFAAAHLTEAFKEVEKAFEKKTGIDVTINFAGTQILRTQIEQGAPADVYASANLSHMKAVQKAGFVDDYKEFAYNTLALIVPKSNPAGIKNFKDLAQNNYNLVIGVENVPIGIYTREVFDNADKVYGADFKKKVLTNVVSLEPDVKKVAGKVTLGAADAGFTYVTDITPSIQEKVQQIEIPKKLNVISTDTIAIVNSGDHPKNAKKWIDFVLSDEGQDILEDHHLIKMDEKEK
jgi:molybdate transport system substrate-binding protein